MKKYSSGSFIDAALRVYGSEADTITSFPATVYADGESASAVIYGNMQQSGTPTPSSPIYPSECGDLVASGEHAGQYTIPILSGGMITSIYLPEPLRKIGDYADTIGADGAVTRRIKKLEFNGNEEWTYTSPAFTFKLPNLLKKSTAVCDAYAWAGIYLTNDLTFTTDRGDGSYIWIRDNQYNSDINLFKAFLASQYAASTPITIWYILATPTTDQITMPIIHTSAGSQQFDVNTTLKPSAVQLTYTGWHTHSDKKRSGGAWV